MKKHEANVVLLDDRKPRLFNKQGIPLQQIKNDSTVVSKEETKAKQISQKRIHSESKKTENTLKKFNSSFGTDHGTVGIKTLNVEKHNSTRAVSPNNRQLSAIHEMDVSNARFHVNQRLGVAHGDNKSNQIISEQSKQQRTLSPIYESGTDKPT